MTTTEHAEGYVEGSRRWVWVPCPQNLFKPAYVVKEEELETVVQGDTLERVKNVDIFKMNPSKFDGVEDLAFLSHLNEPSVLHNLQLRYESGEIYTYSGLFLLALNPFKPIGIYGDDRKRDVMLQKQRECSPHIFVIANEAYRSLVTNRENQSILITGESGAGKTENTKRVIEFLAYAARSGGGEYSPEIEAGLSAANPLLEAFGNAKTIKNDNSSRFGKFIQIKFRGGTMCGARIEGYLLEKTRIARISPGERNFHILYYFLAGASDEELEECGLVRGVENYACLRGGEAEICGIDDKEGWERVRNAFGTLRISPQSYVKMLALVLHLSNIEFVEENGKCIVRNTDLVERICGYLGVPVTDFLKNLLVPTLRAGQESVLRHRSVAEARAVINGLMKTLYENLFFCLIREINERLDSAAPNDPFVGILDIAGFEIFAQNSFEQFCINYTNEKLQQYFNHHMFVLEQELYRSEEIEWNFIDFGLDLEPTIRAIESINPIGILAYLDEECVMGWGNDKRLLDKITSAWLSADGLVQRVPFRDAFRMRHYAGDVEYCTARWVEKNRDVESEPLVSLVSASTVGNTSATTNTTIRNPHHEATMATAHSCGGSPHAASSAASSDGVKKGIFRTVAQAHRENLRTLMAALRGTQPHFVRCILPNLERRPEAFDRTLVLGQLRCNGVLEGIRISRLGYPTRLPYADFLARYNMLASAEQSPKNLQTPKSRSKKLVQELMISENDYRLGKTRIFFRQGVMADLEERREACVLQAAVRLQEVLRGVLRVVTHRRSKYQASVVTKLRKNAKLSLVLLRWRWWSLLHTIAPLLDVKRSDGCLKAAEERARELSACVEKQRGELQKAQTNVSNLQRRTNELEAAVMAAAGALRERDELLSALRGQNEAYSGQVESAEREMKRQHEVICGLKEKIAGAEQQLENHADAMARLENSLRSERAARESAERDAKEAKQRIDELVRANEEALREHAAGNSLAEELVRVNENALRERDELRRELGEATAARTAALSALGEIRARAESAGVPCRLLLSKLRDGMQSVVSRIVTMYSILFEENARLQGANRELGAYAEKQRCELLEAQSNLSGLESQKCKLEARLAEAEDRVRRLHEDVEYRIAVAATLERHLEERRCAEREQVHEEITKSKLDSLCEAGGDEALQKEVQTLRREAARLNAMYTALSAERNQLHEENIRLTKSKLDDLFQCEAEFAAAKSALRTEVRRLELENERLRREIEAQQSGSEYSEDLVALLEGERARARAAVEQMSELEMRNVRLESEVASLSAEMVSMEAMLRKAGSRGATLEDVQGLRRELRSVQRLVDEVFKTFQRDFFVLFNERVAENEMLLKEVEALQRESGEAECLRVKYRRAQRMLEGVRESSAELVRQAESARVDKALAEAAVRECEERAAKLEAVFNEREVELGRLRERLVREAAAISRLHSRLEAETQNGGECHKCESQSSVEVESVSAVNATLQRELARITSLYSDLEVSNKRCTRELEVLRRENAELRDRQAEIAEVFGESMRPEPLVVQRVVTVRAVDKEALKALLWKRVVAEKCARCAGAEREAEDDESLDDVRLKNEIRLLRLRLAQSERRNAESERLIASMQACITARRGSSSGGVNRGSNGGDINK